MARASDPATRAGCGLLPLLLAHYPLAHSHDRLTRYDAKGGLLTLALDLGSRLLPALQVRVRVRVS